VRIDIWRVALRVLKGGSVIGVASAAATAERGHRNQGALTTIKD
jgi:hypothetical protein